MMISLAIPSFISNLFDTEALIELLLSLPIVILAICVHEYSHARVAYHFGDPTAKACGRMTLNPVKHFHPIGFMLLVFARVGFANPVPINPVYFKNRKRDEILVSLAGPASNILMALCFILFLKVYVMFCQAQEFLVVYGQSAYFTSDLTYYVYLFFASGVLINLSLAIFNLIPLPPLDGSHLLTVLMPNSWKPIYYKVQPFMPYIFIVAWIAGGLSWLVSTPVSAIMEFLINVIVY